MQWPVLTHGNVWKWREHLDKGRDCAALFIAISRAFAILSHDLSMAKLYAMNFIISLSGLYWAF